MLYGTAFVDSSAVFYVLLPSIYVFPFSRFLGTHIMGMGSPRLNAYRQFVMLTVLAGSAFWMVPVYGPVGAALCLSGTYVVGTILTITLYTRLTRSSLVQVLVPTKEDFRYYVNLLRQVKISQVGQG
jgi:O-antigen/teichoic acid export membrane protein